MIMRRARCHDVCVFVTQQYEIFIHILKYIFLLLEKKKTVVGVYTYTHTQQLANRTTENTMIY